MNAEQIRQNGAEGLNSMADALEGAAENLETTFSRSKEHLQEIQEKALEASRAACETTNKYVRDNPWQAVGIAAAVGLVAGLLIRRR